MTTLDAVTRDTTMCADLARLAVPDLAGHPSVQVSIHSDPASWDAFVEAHPHGTVEHLWPWRDVFASVFGQQPVYLSARRGDAVVGVLPLVRVKSLLFGKSVVSLPYANYAGLLASDDAVAAALVHGAGQDAREFGAAYVELRHIRPATESLPRRGHKVGSRLALPRHADTLWAHLDRKVRNQVRKAEKEKLVVACGGLDLIDEFYDVFSVNMRDLGTPVFPRALFRGVATAFGDRARVFVVRLGSRPIAAAIALTWRNTILVPWASSLRPYRSMCANMLLYWSMLQFAIAAGSEVFDFGRSTAGGGTLQFKQQWGATEFPLSWEYVLLAVSEPPDHGTSSPRVERLIELWKRLPVWMANAVGPVVVRHLS